MDNLSLTLNDFDDLIEEHAEDYLASDPDIRCELDFETLRRRNTAVENIHQTVRLYIYLLELVTN